MGENNIHKESEHVRDRFQMEPPENAWNLLDAELEKKQASMYWQRGNRFKWLSIGLALLLVSSVTWYYIVSNHAGKSSKEIANTVAAPTVNNTEVSKSSSADKAADVNKTADNKTLDSKRGLGAWDPGHSSLVPRSSSIQTNHTKQIKSHGNQAAGKRKQEKVNTAEGKSIAVKENNLPVNGESGNTTALPDEDKSVSGATAASVDNDTEDGIGSVTDSQSQAGCNDNAAPQLTANSNINDSLLHKASPRKSPWSVAAYYAPNYYSRNSLVSATPGYAVRTDDYEAREKSDYSFAAGISVHYDLSDHWSVAVGGMYSTIAYSINLPAIYAWKGSDNQLHYKYPTSCGTIEVPNEQYTPGYYGDTLNMTGNCKQVVKFINVPVTARYRFTTNRLTFFADGGLSANFVIREEAILNIAGQETTIINNIDGLKAMNFGYLLGFGMQYDFNNGVGIFIEPVYRGSINSLTKDTPFYCYPYAFALTTGISLHF